MPLPRVSVHEQLWSRAAVARTLLRPVERPDRLPRALLAMLPWGPGMLGGAAAAAARYPRAAAIVDDDGAVTYRRLWRRSGAVAAGLEVAGARPGAVIGLLARDHRGFAEALLAGLRTGARVVLLNTGFAGPQLAGVVAAEGIDLLLHDDEFAAAAATTRASVTWGEGQLDVLAQGRESSRAPAQAGHVVILTSGTTGRPKGARRDTEGGVSGGALDLAGAVLARIPLRARDTQVLAAPLFHAWGLAHLGLGLARCATTIVARRFDPGQTLAAVSERRAEVLVVVPQMLQRILDLDADALDRADTSRLRVIASSGAALGPTLADRALRRFGPVLYNLYGSTEVAAATIATPRDLAADPGTAGRAVPGVHLAVLDAAGAAVPTGEVGRVFVGSDAGFEGYTSGDTREQHDGLISTGDLGYVDRAGRLTIVGREDDMIVSGGENVFPAEVEQLLAAHPAVAEVGVVGVPDERFGQALAAFVVVRAGHELSEQAVRSHVREHLARFKVPRTVTFLDTLPRNATGKLLRRELGR